MHQVRPFVYYRSADYAGFLRRAAASAVDLAVVYVASTALLWAAWLAGAPPVQPAWALAAVAWPYLVLLKRSRSRTLGYRLAKLRIVDLSGERPGLFLLTLRLFWWLQGPLVIALDLVYQAGDRERQTIRDKLTRMYVVRADAQPAGTGALVGIYLDFMALGLVLREVAHPEDAKTPDAVVPSR